MKKRYLVRARGKINNPDYSFDKTYEFPNERSKKEFLNDMQIWGKRHNIEFLDLGYSK